MGHGTEVDLPLAFYWISKGMEKVRVTPDIVDIILNTLMRYFTNINIKEAPEYMASFVLYLVLKFLYNFLS